MAGVERVAVHVSRLAHCPAVFFVEFSRAGSVGNLVVPLDRSEAEALRDELGEALSGWIMEAPDVMMVLMISTGSWHPWAVVGRGWVVDG